MTKRLMHVGIWVSTAMGTAAMAAAMVLTGPAHTAVADPAPGIDPGNPAIVDYQRTIDALIAQYNQSSPAERVGNAQQLIGQIAAENARLRDALAGR